MQKWKESVEEIIEKVQKNIVNESKIKETPSKIEPI